MTTKKAFGWVCVGFAVLAGFFSIVLHNSWHAIAIFVLAGVGVWLLKDE